jgi:hypothetical protein
MAVLMAATCRHGAGSAAPLGWASHLARPAGHQVLRPTGACFRTPRAAGPCCSAALQRGGRRAAALALQPGWVGRWRWWRWWAPASQPARQTDRQTDRQQVGLPGQAGRGAGGGARLQQAQPVLHRAALPPHAEEDGAKDERAAGVGHGARDGGGPVSHHLPPAAHQQQPELAQHAHAGPWSGGGRGGGAQGGCGLEQVLLRCMMEGRREAGQARRSAGCRRHSRGLAPDWWGWRSRLVVKPDAGTGQPECTPAAPCLPCHAGRGSSTQSARRDPASLTRGAPLLALCSAKSPLLLLRTCCAGSAAPSCCQASTSACAQEAEQLSLLHPQQPVCANAGWAGRGGAGQAHLHACPAGLLGLLGGEVQGDEVRHELGRVVVLGADVAEARQVRQHALHGGGRVGWVRWQA